MWDELLQALALVFIFEGIMPFSHPKGSRQVFQMMAEMHETKLRFIGLTSMLFGLLLLYLFR